MRFLFFSTLLFLTMTWSCASTKGRTTENLFDIDPAIREMTRGSGSIKLLDHQLRPIDYLHRHPEQKGLLINHYMGTGKTFLGIGFAQSFPNRKVIVLAPKFLESHWRNQVKEFGVKNPERFTFLSYEDAPSKLEGVDLSQHIILADEVHNLIRYMRTMNIEANARYTELFLNLQKAYKIIGLTGTPIYGDESDIAFIINFVSGQNIMPFNQETFRLKYTTINPTRQYFRGFLTESNLMGSAATLAASGFFTAMVGTAGLVIGIPIAVFVPVIVNRSLKPPTFPLRTLDVEKMRPVINKYISYYRYSENHFKDFPAMDFKVVEVPYNRYQYSFFFRLVEGDLPFRELQRLLKNEPIKRTDDYVRINSTILHQQIYSSIGAGRDIGNFDFFGPDDTLVEAPKFVKLLDELNKHDEPTVIYSNFYHTGILAFRDFLIRQRFKRKYAIIEPNLSVDEVDRIVSEYNRGELKLLLLHPDVTEGISLRGTQFLHILEPMLNSTVLEQVIGRSRRFQSHAHLPKDKQTVFVRMWLSTSSNWNLELGNINRANWFKRYRELSYLSRWGIGISQIDKNYDKKVLNPEELAMLKLKTIEKNFARLQEILVVGAIERNYQR